MNNVKQAVKFILLGFVALSLIYLIIDELKARNRGINRAFLSEVSAPFVLLYFHGNHRCTLCLNLERTCKEALKEGFAAQIRKGILAWRAINWDLPQNEHFVEEFNLSLGGPVLVDTRAQSGGRYKVLEESWQYALKNDEVGLKNFIVKEVKKFLQGASDFSENEGQGEGKKGHE